MIWRNNTSTCTCPANATVIEELADQAWDKGAISDFWAAWAWWTIAQNKPERPLSACDFNRSMQHLDSHYREEDVENETERMGNYLYRGNQ